MPTVSASAAQGWDAPTSPFHAAEHLAQQRAGVVQEAEATGRRGIRRAMPDQHRQFFNEQPFMVFGGIDAQGQPWATLRAGEPGFVSAPDSKTLRIDGGALPGDPLRGLWQPGMMIGGLGLQPQTRRRNRVNGVIADVTGAAVTLNVTQSFGNCAKYIQSRTPTFDARHAGSKHPPVETASELSDADREWLGRADTFFIASANLDETAGAARGVDVSHRGGLPGFVRVDDATTLTTPDFSGNRFFNTLGNLLHDPRAGLLFVDFINGDLLYVAALAEIVWDGPELAAFPLAERLVRFRIVEVRRTRAALPFRWSDVAYAPQFVAPVKEVAKEASASSWRHLSIAEVVDETPGIRSFYFESTDGAPLPPFEPGQYLPIRVPVDATAAPLTRTYTLSAASDTRRYRISVKRDGVASTWLHEHAVAGSRIEAMAPRGKFVYDSASPRPAVFISAGIGITPMFAMLQHTLAAFESGTPRKPLHFFHGARSPEERPFGPQLEVVAARHPEVSLHLYDSAAGAAMPLSTGRQTGRVTIAALKHALPFDDYDFYLCGPAAFMSELYEGLRALNVADERIRFEAFGPATVRRSAEKLADTPAAQHDAEAVPVTFARSQRTVQWLPKDGTLLEFAEACGIATQSSCRSGMCGTCSTRLTSGQVEYDEPTDAPIAPGHALICMARPLVDAGGQASALELDL